MLQEKTLQTASESIPGFRTD